MKQIKKILFPTDFSEMSRMAYSYCLDIAREFGAAIDVLHVYKIDFGVLPVQGPMANQMVEERQRNTNLKLGAFAYLQESDNQSLIDGLDISAFAVVGLAEDEIASYSKNNDVDLIIMPTKGEHNVLEVLFGSVTTSTVAKAECPVLVVPEGTQYSEIKNIAYATDFSTTNIGRVDAPIQLAELFGASLHYVHIYTEEEATAEQIEKLLTVGRDKVKVHFHQLKGSTVQDGMEDFLDVEKIGLLMTFSPPKNFFERLFRLSTTRYMVENISVPLLVTR